MARAFRRWPHILGALPQGRRRVGLRQRYEDVQPESAAVRRRGEAPAVALGDLARACAGSVTRVVLTLNQHGEADPVDLAAPWPFTLQVRRNARALGFGANHNRALDGAQETFNSRPAFAPGA